jgi:hypothetical protein
LTPPFCVTRRWVTLLSEAAAELLSAVQHVQRAAVDKICGDVADGLLKEGGLTKEVGGQAMFFGNYVACVDVGHRDRPGECSSIANVILKA